MSEERKQNKDVARANKQEAFRLVILRETRQEAAQNVELEVNKLNQKRVDCRKHHQRQQQ